MCITTMCANFILLLLLIGPSLVFCSQVVLFDSSTAVTDLNWDTWTNHVYHPERTGWYEETWAGMDGTDNVRIYGSCSADGTMPSNGSNWVFVPGIPTKAARGVYVELLFTIRGCLKTEAAPCKETVNVHVREFNDAEYGRFRVNRDFDVTAPGFSDAWKKRKVLTMTKGKIDQVTFAFNLKNDTSHIRLAYDDNGACTSILVTKVYYTVCDEALKDFTVYDSTVSNGPDPAENVMVPGKCVDNAVEQNGVTPYAFCGTTGQWTKHVIGGCECLPGYTSAKVNGRRTCHPCSPDSFKEGRGPGKCLSCPEQSITSERGSGHCTCMTGFYRAPNESVSLPCTQPPNHPTNLVVKYANQSTVELRWDEPSNFGGRKEIWYEWECTRGDCSAVRGHPADRRLNSRVLRISGLKADTEYSFNVFAKNKVSETAGEAAAAYRAVDVRTSPVQGYGISGLRVDGEMKGGVQIAWNPPDVQRRISQYEIEISAPALSTVETRTSSAPSYSASNLRNGNIYLFRVRANVDGWSEWSSPMQYEAGRRLDVAGRVFAAGNGEPESAALPIFSLWMVFIVVGFIILVLLCILLCCRLTKKNRKQMSDLDVLDTYKQDTITPDYNSGHRQFNEIFRSSKLNAPLIAPYGSSISQPPPYYGGNGNGKFKPYVDPTAYEDPNQALTEFTFDIDPSAVYITQVIGGGEFGDVCMGGLKKNMIGGNGHEQGIDTVAIKTLKPGSGGKAKADFLLEASIMGQFCHPNVVRLIGVVTRSEPAMIVTEYMENGSLDHFLRGRDARGEELGWPRVVDMLRGIAAGMKYLTDKGYVHRDLAARNVLVDSNLNCKIADFGLSRGVDDTAEAEYTTNGGKIPVRWTSPEAITHRKFTAASDVWSFGVLAWEVCSFGERPYWDWTNQKVISEIMSGYRLPAPMDCPASLHRVMVWCWKLERHDRPSFAQLLAILEKYARNPDYIYADSGLLAKHAVSNAQLDNSYGVVRPTAGSGSPACPPPPTGSPPIYPQLDDFLRSLGMGHTTEKLTDGGIFSVSDLSRRSHLDLLAMGLISEEYQRIRDALQHLQLSRGLSRPELAGTMSSRGRPGLMAEEGFFV